VLSALLNSLQMGFRTLAIEKRSSEVWSVLAAVKSEFGRFGEVLGRVQKKLQEASNVVETAATRGRAIEKKLRDVQELPDPAGIQKLPEEEQPLIDFGSGST
jgi:DNA recombination protein RmuC